MLREGCPVTAPALKLVSWNLTRRCNLDCGHCYLDAVQRKSEAAGEVTTEEALHFVADIGATAPGAMLVLTGGEPLLRADLERIVGAATAAGLTVVVGTNGVLLDHARAGTLAAAGAAGVGISLDSTSTAFHDRLRGVAGSWAAALGGVRAARAAGLAVQLQATMFEENRDEIAALADLAQAEGALAMNYFFLVCTGRGVTQTDLDGAAYEQALTQIVALLVRTRCAPYARRLLGLRAGGAAAGYAEFSSACMAGRSYLRITPQARVTPCPYITETVGDLRRQALAAIWQHPTLHALRGQLPGGKCGDCDYRYGCGGCRARAAAACGDLMAEDPKCNYRRPGQARPEPPPLPPREARRLAWQPDAEALLERIPGFVRERVRARLEQRAVELGIMRVDAAFMRSQQARSPLAALQRPASPPAASG
jgi:radical SAM protein with 4Fe4S-binding SPASM domain